jgi:hypothetical protein
MNFDMTIEGSIIITMTTIKVEQQKKRMTLEGFATMIQKDLQAIHAEMATKEDLKRFATKEDLKGFATKEDLKGFATKEDIRLVREEMATKEDIRLVREEMATKENLKRFATKEDFEALPTYADVGNIVSEAKSEILKEMDKFKYAKEIDEVRGRVVRIEKKLGMKAGAA